MRPVLLALALSASTVVADPTPDPVGGLESPVPGFVDGLYHVVDLDLPDEAGAPFDLDVLFGEMDHVHLDPHSFRGASFQVLADRGEGVLEPVQVPEPRTYRGTTTGGGHAAGSLLDDGLTLQINFDEADEAWFIEPLSAFVEGAPHGRHIVYRREAEIAPPAWCDGGLETGALPEGRPNPSRSLYLCEIAFDADFEFYGLNGSSEANTVADIENVMAGVELAYERDCGIIYEITTVIVRTTSNDPYTSNVPETLLGQFQSHWNGNQQGVHRDVAHLMTGRNMQGSVIGIAFLRGVCNANSGYGLSESRFTGAYNSRVALTAHELGHNWGANHCDSQGNANCDIMCSGLGGCGGYGAPEFEDPSIASITDWAARVDCLDVVPGGNIDLPLNDIFASTDLDLDVWQDVQGVEVNGDATDEPSQPYAMNLDADDHAATGPVLAAGLIGQQVYAQYWVASSGVESG
ncbi:MAG: hypothetical protein KDA28_02670, partial [Phycisphaerales bacterium]|nr:hypothetical protein [Phycisphaerales bacterium]